MLSLHIKQISPALFLLNYPKNFLLPLSFLAHRLWAIEYMGYRVTGGHFEVIYGHLPLLFGTIV